MSGGETGRRPGLGWRQHRQRAAQARAVRCPSRNRSRAIETMVGARWRLHERYTSAACGVHAANRRASRGARDACSESTCIARRSRALPAPSRHRAAPGRVRAPRTETSCFAASGATACCPLSHQLENMRKHHSTRRKYEPTHQWMPGGTIAAPPQSVKVATLAPPCMEVAALWPTYSRIAVVIRHPSFKV